MADPPRGLLARIVGVIDVVGDAIHVVIAILLAVLGLGLIIDTVRHIALVLVGPYSLPEIVLAVLDLTLLLFIVAELLHTSAIALRRRGALDPEPFLVIGLVAGIRRVLIVTAEAGRPFQWNPHGIELLILMGLILVMAGTTLMWRYSSRLPDSQAR
jgi:branched-subunit amino acid transport protein